MGLRRDRRNEDRESSALSRDGRLAPGRTGRLGRLGRGQHRLELGSADRGCHQASKRNGPLRFGLEREAVDILYFDGLSQADAAKILRVSVRTVQRRWHSALLLLHEKVADQWSDL